MSDPQFSTLAISSLSAYGAPALALLLFISALGIPSPATISIVAAGAMARLGLVDSVTAILLGLLGVVLGDSVVYGLGRFGRSWSQQRFSESPTWRKAEAIIRCRGGAAIYLTRWLITAPAIPVTLAAAGSGFSYFRFLAYDAAGELTWIMVFGGLGYLFGNEWEQITSAFGAYTAPVLAAVAAIMGAYLLIHFGRSRSAVSAAAVIARPG